MEELIMRTAKIHTRFDCQCVGSETCKCAYRDKKEAVECNQFTCPECGHAMAQDEETWVNIKDTSGFDHCFKLVETV